MRPLACKLFCSLRYVSRSFSDGSFPFQHRFNNRQDMGYRYPQISSPGLYPADVWLTQRQSNDNLQSALFPNIKINNEENNFVTISSGVAHISGKPVNDNLRYETVSKFLDLNLDSKLMDNISLMQLSSLTPVQQHAIPLLLSNFSDISDTASIAGAFDLMAAAQTGSGKTLAYLLPILQRLMQTFPHEAMKALSQCNCCTQYPSALIIAPTRELVQQIRMEASKLCYRSQIRPVAFFGGESPSRQLGEINRGCHVAVATPGRLLDFLNREVLNLSYCKTLIVDEADRMLDMGFEPQLRKILENPTYGMPSSKHDKRQTALFSATFPKEVAVLARDFLRGEKCISLNVVPENTSDPHLIAPVWGKAVRRPSSEQTFSQLKASVPKEIVQRVHWISEDNKIERLKQLTSLINNTISENVELDNNANSVPETQRVLVFCNTKIDADRVDHYLMRQGLKSVCIHGDRSQNHRTNAVRMFKSGNAHILVATSIAARGLDFPSVKAVINFGIPLGLDDYVHRIGRTGRMGHAGLSITLLGGRDLFQNTHLQQVARGICRLIQESTETSDSIPAEFLREARFNDNSNEVQEANSNFRRKSSFPDRRQNNYSNRYPSPRRSWQ